MNREYVTRALVEALARAVNGNGKDLPDLDETTLLAGIEGFESDDWPYSMAEISDDLGIEIPDDINIFIAGKAKQKRRRSLSEVVDLLVRLSHKAAA